MAHTSTVRARLGSSPLTGPVRTCIGCRQRAAKQELVRVTAGSGSDGRAVVLPDPTGTAPGRGAHLHPTTACLALAVRRKAFGRALRVTDGLDPAPVAAFLAPDPGPPQHAQHRSTDQDWSSSS